MAHFRVEAAIKRAEAIVWPTDMQVIPGDTRKCKLGGEDAAVEHWQITSAGGQCGISKRLWIG
jgi:hypothetical protein